MKIKILIRLLTILFLVACSKAAYPVSLQWDPNPEADFVTSYKIYRVKGNTATIATTVTAPATTANVDNYLSGNRTVFYVTAVNFSGESLPSSKVTIQKH